MYSAHVLHHWLASVTYNVEWCVKLHDCFHNTIGVDLLRVHCMSNTYRLADLQARPLCSHWSVNGQSQLSPWPGAAGDSTVVPTFTHTSTVRLVYNCRWWRSPWSLYNESLVQNYCNYPCFIEQLTIVLHLAPDKVFFFFVETLRVKCNFNVVFFHFQYKGLYKMCASGQTSNLHKMSCRKLKMCLIRSMGCVTP